MSFSRDGRYLIALGDDDDSSIVVHECTSKPTESKWTTSSFVARAKAKDVLGEKVLNSAFNPFSNNIVTTGVKHMKFWELHQAGEMLGRNGVFGGESPDETHLCVTFLDAETCITGTATGMLWIWKGVRALQVIAWAHEGPIFDLAVDGRMVLSGGQDLKLCLWNMQKDFRVVPPGKVDRGEMLVKQLFIADTVKRGEPESRWLEQIGVGCVRSLAWNAHRIFVGTSYNHIFVVDDLKHSAALIMSGHHRGGMTGVCSHPKLPWILSAGREGTILVRNMVTKKTILARNLEINRAIAKSAKDVGPSVVKHKVKPVAVEPQRKMNAPQGQEEEEEEEEEEEAAPLKKDWPVQLTCIDTCLSGTNVAVGQDDGGFAILSLEYSAQELIFDDLLAVVPKKLAEPVTCLKISPSEGSIFSIAVGFLRGNIKIYQAVDLWKRKPPFVLCKGLSGKVIHIDWDKFGRTIRANDSKHDLKTFDVRSGSEIDYFGAMYTVKLKRLRFFPEVVKSFSEDMDDVEKMIGFGMSRQLPYLVQSVKCPLDSEGVPQGEPGYSNELIQIGDRVIEVAGRAVEHCSMDTVRQFLRGAACKPECEFLSPGTCPHSTVEIRFAKNRSGNFNVGPGTGAKIYERGTINAEECGPYHLEGKWVTNTCTLTWASHRLYLDKYIPGEVLSLAKSLGQKLMAVGDTFGQVCIVGYPCDPEKVEKKEGQKIFCRVDHVCFTTKDKYLLVGNETHAVLMQWKPLLVTEGTRRAESRVIPQVRTPPDGITNVHMRLILDRPLASRNFIQAQVNVKPVQEDAFDAKLQWWQNAVPDAEQRDGTEGALCDRELILDHAYGYNGREGRHNVFELPNGDVLFPVGCLCVLNRALGLKSQVIGSPSEVTQNFFRGHSDFVISLAVHPNGTIIASGDCGPRPLICVWDIDSSDWLNRSLTIALASVRGFHRNGVSALSFSSDGEYLASVGEDASHSIAVYNWQNDPLMPFAVYPSGQNHVLCCAFNPYAFEFVTCGVKHVSFWSFEPNPSAEVEKLIACKYLEDTSGKDVTDILLQLLLTLTPDAVAKTCPSRILKRGSSLSDNFMEWAIYDEECSPNYNQAKTLGDSLVLCTSICATYINRQTAVTGTIDGKILVWTNTKLFSFVNGHTGPIFDVDCPKNRGNFRGDIMITNIKNEKHFVSVKAQGAITEQAMHQVAQEALEDWHKEFKRTNIIKSNPPLIKNALIRWEASEPQEFVTCGEDSTIKFWGMVQVLQIGESKFEVDALFERFRTRSGHKFRAKTVALQDFVACLTHLQVLYVTENVYDAENEKMAHTRLSKAEAVRIFRDHNAPELHYGDFVTCIERIFNLLAVRAEAEHLQLVNLREELEENLAHYQTAQKNDSRGKTYVDTFDYSILKTKDDIKKIDAQLRKGRFSTQNTIRCIRVVKFERPNTNNEEATSAVDCLRSIYLNAGNFFVGTSKNTVFAFDMQSGKWKALACGHECGPIHSICSYPSNANMLVSAGQDNQLIVWNGNSRVVDARRTFSSPVTALDFSPTSHDTLAVGLYSGDISILDLSKGTLTNSLAFSHSKDHISTLRFSPDGQWVAVGYDSAKIRLFEIRHDSIEKQLGVKLMEHANVFHGHNGPVSSIDWSVDCKLIQSASQLAGELLYWTSDNGQMLMGLDMSEIKQLKWSSFTSIFGWHMHGPSKHVARPVKFINKDVDAAIGQRVKRADGKCETAGTIIRLSKDKRCDVRWDTNIIEGTIGAANNKRKHVYIGYGGTPQFHLVSAEQSSDAYAREIITTDQSNKIDKFNPPFTAVGDGIGNVQLFPSNPPVMLADNLVVHQQFAHPGGTHVLRLSKDDQVLYSTGRSDHCLLQWTCQPRKNVFFSISEVLRKCASMGVREFFGGLGLLVDDLFQETTVISVRKRQKAKDILEEIKLGLTFGPKEIVGVTIVLDDEGKSVPKSSDEEAKKEKAIKQTLSEAVGIMQSRIQYIGWERASTDPTDPSFNWSHVHLNLLSAEFEGFGKISSAELFADQIIEQVRDPTSKLRKAMVTRVAISAKKMKAFEWIPEPPPLVTKKGPRQTHVVACEYRGCDGAKVEEDEEKKIVKVAGEIGYLLSKTAGLDFRFRRLRTLVFDSIIRTSVTNVNAMIPSKAPKPLYRAKKPNLAHQQLVNIFQILDYGDRGWISHADFLLGLRRNPDFSGLLGLPTIDLQKSASRHIYELRYGDEGLDSTGIDDSKKMDMEEFVSFFGLKKKETVRLESIENSKWTVSSHVMKTPSICDARLSIKGRPPMRRWNQRLNATSTLPVMTKEEALNIFNELGLSNNESMTMADFVWHLQKNRILEDKLGGKRIKPEELAAFFSNMMSCLLVHTFTTCHIFACADKRRVWAGDVGIWNPLVEKEAQKHAVPIRIAFQVFQTIDQKSQGFLTMSSLVDGLKRFPAMADSLGLLSRVMRHDALPQIYTYMYKSRDVIASRKIDIVEFVKIFSNCDLGLHILLRAP
jgi:WD40 repeat protein